MTKTKKNAKPSAAAKAPEAPAKKGASKKIKPVAGEKTKLETYEIVEVHRSQLKDAPYNPRILSEDAKAKLRRGMKRHGLMAPPTWNKRTGNIVGGHQRIKSLDALNGTADYRLTVAAVDFSEAQEKEANIILNNAEAQGDFDIEKLGMLLKDTDLDLDGTGFDDKDLYRLFGDSPATLARESTLDAMGDRVRAAYESYEENATRVSSRDATDFYIVVVFKDEAHRDGFLEKFGFDGNRFQSGAAIEERLHPPQKETA